MKQRVLSGIMLVASCVAIIVCNGIFPLALNIVVAIVSALGVFELIKAMGIEKKWFLSIPSLLAAAAIPFCGGDMRLLVYCIFTAVVFSAMIVYHKETSFKEVGVLFSMVALIPTGLQCLVSLRDLNPTHGMYYPLVGLFCAWVSDAGAYFAGTLLGKHKLCPEISPHKTVEGAIGGCVVNIIVMIISGFIVSQWTSGGVEQVNFAALFIIGCIGTPVSILGDLSFSLIKRSCHIKDFGQVIPGHGGILDRFDSVIFTAPFVYFVAMYMPLLY